MINRWYWVQNLNKFPRLHDISQLCDVPDLAILSSMFHKGSASICIYIVWWTCNIGEGWWVKFNVHLYQQPWPDHVICNKGKTETAKKWDLKPHYYYNDESPSKLGCHQRRCSFHMICPPLFDYFNYFSS